MPPSPLPTYAYKILPGQPPSPIPVEYPLSELDQTDGFVHLSTASQIPTTAGLFFTEATSLWILKLRFTFADKCTWENGDGCPHLRGNFGAADTEDTKQFVRSEGETWEDAFSKQAGWLI
ncbi:hypothetical protein BX600DRAFT_509814 [Xylariales sp. PMI_506]|nr:hypothetical protein BX600DRAFT_509814 [Xylariales sp. PMI_506]